MRVYIPSIYRTKNIGGKELFCKRLSEEFKNIGIKVVKDESDKHDITLQAGFIRKKEKAKVVFRADGVYNDIKIKYKNLNKRIKKTFSFSNAVVYQSKFSMIMCDKYVGRFKGKSTIILNGFDIFSYKNVFSFKSKYKYNFLTASKWRPHKRLKDIIKSFNVADIKNSCLFVAGDVSLCGMSDKYINKYIKKYSNIIFLGKLNQEELSSYIKMCDCFVHLCWQDSCPNGVVEAVAANKPVITNNVGGTKEIVIPSGGIICNIDKEYDYLPCDLYNPPKINHQIIADAMRGAVSNDMIIKNKHIDIRYIAKQYVNFFENILIGK